MYQHNSEDTSFNDQYLYKISNLHIIPLSTISVVIITAKDMRAII